uniref:Uncharacterized protein n=1 Tax=viral metagenome TaxID=1070528 RepID=A0A6M3J1T5_9ZZZZ
MPISVTTTGFYGGLTVSELEKAIMWELGQVVGLDANFNKFPQWLIRQKLNDRQNKFVFHSQCLKKFCLIAAKADYRQYKLPDNCMDGGVISGRFYDTASSYQELEIVDQHYMNTVEEGYLVDSSSTPQYIWQGDMYGNVPTLAVHPPADTAGTVYDASSDTGVAIGGLAPASSTNTTGTATGGSGTTLDDTTTTFTDLGLVPGVYVRNTTDGSYAYIQSIATNTLTFAATLTGGTANTFSAGDSYEILLGEYGVMTGWDSSGDKFIFGYDYGLVAKITVPANTFMVHYMPYPHAFPETGNPGQYPEIPRLYHMDFAMGVVADLLRTFHESSREFKRAEYYEAIFNMAVTFASGKKNTRPFKDKPIFFRPRIK